MRYLCVLVWLVLGATSATNAAEAETARAGVMAALDASAAAWSAGKLDAFMTSYEDSPQTIFVAGGLVVHGYQAIHDRYAAKYGAAGAASMGHLTLELLDFRLLDANHAYFVGRYHLTRSGGPPAGASGLTTLVFHHSGAGWRIIADHSE